MNRETTLSGISEQINRMQYSFWYLALFLSIWKPTNKTWNLSRSFESLIVNFVFLLIFVKFVSALAAAIPHYSRVRNAKLSKN